MAAGAAGSSLPTTMDREHPEWRLLLRLIEEALREVERPQWTRVVPEREHDGRGGQPLLDGAVINVAPRVVGRWISHILARAAAAGTDVEPLVKAVATGWLDPLSLLQTAVSQNIDHLPGLTRLDGDATLIWGLAPFIAMPMLQACRRAWAERVPAGWAFGYCPICGSWPALAEIQGLDGARHLRCGCCGSDWRTEWLRCPFCGEGDHEQLGSLVFADSRGRKTIEVCDRCRGYVKTIVTLTSVLPEHVMLQDLATLTLDIAALERGYRRPTAKGHEVAVRVVAESARLRDLLGLRR